MNKNRFSKVLVLITGLVVLISTSSVGKAESAALTPIQPIKAINPSVVDPCSAFPLPPPPGMPSDPNTFLTFMESFVVENDATATAYYKAIDPLNKRTTLNDWLVVTGFIKNASDLQPGPTGDSLVKRDAFAIYGNDVDLGVVRRFYSLTDSAGNVFIYTENYRCMSDAKLRNNVLATVTMEYRSAADGTNPTKKFTTFYAYGPDNARILQIDLDGRGAKALPGNCATCHGGKPAKLDITGKYPNKGNIGSAFLPWDMEAFVFDTVDPALSRAAQEGQIKKLSKAAYSTYSKTKTFDKVAGYSRPSALVELVEGWYGGVGLPSPTFIQTFTPKGWLPPYAPATAEELYHKVIVTSCRSCHVSRERAIDFASYRGFAVLHDATEELVFKNINLSNTSPIVRPGDDRAVMPLALKTFNNFWSSSAPALLQQNLNIIKASGTK